MATGREVVNVEVFNIPSSRREINPKNSWASPTPVIENDRVYVHFGADGTAALIVSGTILWKRGSITSHNMARVDRRSCTAIC